MWDPPTIYQHELFVAGNEEGPRWGPPVRDLPGTTTSDPEWFRAAQLYEKAVK